MTIMPVDLHAAKKVFLNEKSTITGLFVHQLFRVFINTMIFIGLHLLAILWDMGWVRK